MAEVATSPTIILRDPRPWRRLGAGGAGRLVRFALLSAGAALIEGSGLLLLVPVLTILGVSGEGAGSGLGADWGAVLGLEGALAVYVALVAAGALLVRARALVGAAQRQAFEDGLRDDLHGAILSMDWARFQTFRVSDLTQTLTGGVTRGGLLVETWGVIWSAGVQTAILAAAAFSLSAPMTLTCLGLAALLALAGRAIDRRAAALGAAHGEAWRALMGNLTDDLAGLRVIRALGAEPARRAAFRQRLADLRRQDRAFQADLATNRVLTQAAAALAAAGGLILATRGFGLAIAPALVIVLVFGRLFQALLRLQDQARRLLHLAAGYREAEDLLTACRAARETPGGTAAPALTRALTLEDLAARHGGASARALRGVGVTIPARRLTALAGPSGAGKSTLADVVLGLLAPEAGVMRVDGVAIDATNRPTWRARVAYVPQDPFLIHDTIRANLRLAAPEADDASLWRALAEASADDFVRAHPQGLDAMVGDRGARLSGGERQRLSLARALLRQPALLILDEATGALDAENERRVLDRVLALRDRLTILLIAHRPSALKVADHVILLEGGAVIAEGDWSTVAAQAAPLLARLDLAAAPEPWRDLAGRDPVDRDPGR